MDIASDNDEQDLVARAIAGERLALERLLLNYHSRLASRIERKIPPDFRGVAAAEDILQETFLWAFRRIGTFRPEGPGAFYRWLATIAECRLLDHLKALWAAKRGGGRRPVDMQVGTAAGSIVNLLELAAVNEHTPSRSLARREAVATIQVALAGLREDYREALQLRYLKGLPVADVAAKMNRTERAVHMLCHRGLKKLQEAVGRASHFLTQK